MSFEVQIRKREAADDESRGSVQVDAPRSVDRIERLRLGLLALTGTAARVITSEYFVAVGDVMGNCGILVNATCRISSARVAPGRQC